MKYCITAVRKGVVALNKPTVPGSVKDNARNVSALFAQYINARME